MTGSKQSTEGMGIGSTQHGESKIVDPAKYRGKVMAVAIAGYAFDGMDIMVLALSLPILLKVWAADGFNMVQAGFVATAMLLGASLGGYIFGPIADKYGRKKALVWCIAFFGITTGLAGFAQNYVQLSILRFLAGLGLGAEWALGGTLLQEFSPPEKRGKASSWMMMGWPLGFGLTILASQFFVPKFSWPILYWIGASAILLAIYIQIAIPESPVWLKAQEDKKKGIASGTGVPSAKMTDLFKAQNLRAFVIVSVICTSLMITYWAVNTWLPTILAQERGLSPKTYNSFLMILQFLAAFAYIISGYSADKVGKRTVMAICSFLSAIFFYLWLGIEWSNNNIFFILGGLTWLFASAIWAILSAFLVEQFPTNIRAVGVASSFATGRLVATLVPIGMGAAAMKLGLSTVMTTIAAFYLICMFAVLMLKDSNEHI